MVIRYSIESGIYHYRSMAKHNFRGYLKEELVPLKKYFYVLRPLLSVLWLEKYKRPAPVEFSKLIHLISEQKYLCKAIEELLVAKRSGLEMGLSAQIPEIHSFIETELARLDTITPDRVERNQVEPKLSEIFRAVLRDAWN